eukprot:TRINITY_DN11424_c0_g1_i1.p1 TRINITY_DN11424_c0_g1~~TRINITY_DN11424_c0_g1_i1.p1  ORF type:complete len:54 (+),score=1.13 TRINITY_DN11424_c0_g1_i1:81-242(+)
MLQLEREWNFHITPMLGLLNDGFLMARVLFYFIEVFISTVFFNPPIFCKYFTM